MRAYLLLTLLVSACGGGAVDDTTEPATEPRDKPGAPETLLVFATPSSLPYAQVDFSADEDATFECRFDDGAFEDCTTPYVLSNRSFNEAHQLEVRAIDVDGLVDDSPLVVDLTRRAVAYENLSQTGLYSDFENRVLAPGVIEFSPTYSLWVDGAAKTRWIRLPPGAQVNTLDMDGWGLPDGTQFWKEFRAPDGTLLETRLIEHRGGNGNAQVDDRPDLWVGAFVWRAADDDADFFPDGLRNVKGTEHDVPRDDECYLCHQGQPDWALGFSAVQMSRTGAAEEVTLRWLADNGHLTNPPASDVPVPGTLTERRALGFLHSNCGHCHNPRGLAWDTVDTMDLLIRSNERSVVGSALYQTTVGESLEVWSRAGVSNRITPGSAAASGLYFRASSREFEDQMPPLYTEVVANEQLGHLAAWIDSL